MTSKYALIAPPRAAATAATCHVGAALTWVITSKPAAHAVASPIAWLIHQPPAIMSVVSRPGTSRTVVVASPNRTVTARAKATIATANAPNASHRVPVSPKTASAGRVSTA